MSPPGRDEAGPKAGPDDNLTFTFVATVATTEST